MEEGEEEKKRKGRKKKEGSKRDQICTQWDVGERNIRHVLMHELNKLFNHYFISVHKKVKREKEGEEMGKRKKKK